MVSDAFFLLEKRWDALSPSRNIWRFNPQISQSSEICRGQDCVTGLSHTLSSPFRSFPIGSCSKNLSASLKEYLQHRGRSWVDRVRINFRANVLCGCSGYSREQLSPSTALSSLYATLTKPADPRWRTSTGAREFQYQRALSSISPHAQILLIFKHSAWEWHDMSLK